MLEPAPELEDLVRAWFAGATAGDPTLIDRHVSLDPGTRLVGSDPSERLSGGRAIADFLRGEVEGGGGKATFAPSNVEAFKEGTVGWATADLTITLPDGASVSPRWSAVWHREDDEWRFVQTHASFGVSNDDVGWRYPSA